MLVRRATDADTAAIQALYDHHKNSPEVLGLTFIASDWPLYLSAPHVSLLVAENRGHVQGFLLGFDLVNWAYVEILVVSKEARSQGAGSALLEAFEHSGGDRWVAVELCLDPDDRSLANWLDRRGYKKPDLVEWRVKLTPQWAATHHPPVDLTGTNPSASSGLGRA